VACFDGLTFGTCTAHETVPAGYSVAGRRRHRVDLSSAGWRATGANGDGSVTALNLPPGTYTCVVVIDPVGQRSLH
jgi:hypothetical protein